MPNIPLVGGAVINIGGAAFQIGEVAGYDGTLAINALGQLVNGHNTPIQLRGANTYIMDGSIYANQNVSQQAFGGFSGTGGPPAPFFVTWGFNCCRITMNVNAFLNVEMATLGSSSIASVPVWSGNLYQADVSGVIKPALLDAIFWARYYKCYIIIDSHFSAPAFTFGGTRNYIAAWGQPLCADYDCTLPYWTAGLGAGPGVTDANGYASSGLVAFLQTYAINPATGTINDIVFEFQNEPYLTNQSVNFNSQNLGAGSTVTWQSILLNGGWVSGYCNQNIGTGTYAGTYGGIAVGIPTSLYGASGQPNTTNSAFCFNWWWRAVGYQQILNGIRSLGATNVCIVSGPGYETTNSTINQWFPTDSLSPQQVAVGWHCYPDGSTASFPSGLDNGHGTANILLYQEAVLAGSSSYTVLGSTYHTQGFPIPIIGTETGDFGGSGASQPTPYMQSITQWADGGTDTATGTKFNGTFSVLPWVWGAPSSYGATGDAENQMLIYGAPFTLVASLNSTVQSGFRATTGTIVITSTTQTIQPGLVITSGAPGYNSFIGPQISGTTGGAGTYVYSTNQTQVSATLTGQYWLPINGAGQTYFNWTSTHTP